MVEGAFGAVDAIDGAAQIHRTGAERILRAAGHEARQIGLALQHVGGWCPIRPFGLARHRLGARPGETLTADSDAVADRFAIAEHKVEIGVRRIDDHGAGGFAGAIIDDLALEAGRLGEALVLFMRHSGGRRLILRHRRAGWRKQEKRIGGCRGGEHGGAERGRDGQTAKGLGTEGLGTEGFGSEGTRIEHDDPRM